MERKSINLGVLFIVGISGMAIILWILAPTPIPRFQSFSEILTTFGRFLSIVGMTLFATALILSARFHFLETFFSGLDKVYNWHNKIGQIALILLLFHPLFLLGSYNNSSFQDVVSFFIPGENFAQNWGIFSLVLLLFLIILTLYLRPKYNLWKWSHKFLGLAFIFGTVHLFMITSDTSRFLPLRLYMFIVCGVAIYAFIYHSILGKFTVKKHKYFISNIKILKKDILEISLLPKKEALTFNPGQFVFINFFDNLVGKESHPFSISSSPSDLELRFTIKNLGDHTKNFNKLQKGSQAEIEGPFGKFSYKNSIYRKQIWIAGGIGITPFLSMARSIKQNNGYSIDLYFCLKDEQEVIYLSELTKLKDIGINVILYYSAINGHINASKIKEISKGIKDKAIFICAPVFMIRSLNKQLKDIGVPAWAIHSEEFNL